MKNQPGIRRMPDKIFRQADQLRKQQQQQQTQHVATSKAKSRSATPTETEPKKEAPTPTPSDNGKSEESLNLERGLSESLVEALYCGSVKAPTTTSTSTGKASSATSYATTTTACDNSESTTTTDDSSILKISSTDDDASILPSTKDSTDDRRISTDSPFKGISLKDFEQHRKMIEEQNKQKKQMLYKAIEQHTQKTAAESRKIEEIRHELSKLESDLAVDVALLRKQIDTACIHFANVEKQYIKIEAQFLKAKCDLHNASEKKELLTEHLCTVIAHNEDRKAQKLTELMQKVGLAPTDDEQLESPTLEK
ncbi:hypothetical protein ACLKA7_015980 [Drosophila subpalustris]